MKTEDAMKMTGRTFLARLYEDEVMHLDGKVLTKPALAEMGVVNFGSARRLGAYLRRLKIKTTAELATLSPWDLVRVRLHGPALLWTAMLLLDAGGHDPLLWWGEAPTMSTVKRWPKRKLHTMKGEPE